ncbi:cobalt transporter subunit CbtB [Oxalobacteraceae bacterium GrIS 1.11]
MSSIPAIVGRADAQSQVWKDQILPVLLAGCLGTLLLYGAAFASTEALHNAAHDGRHSAGFPCH